MDVCRCECTGTDQICYLAESVSTQNGGGENRTGSGDWSARASRGSLVTVVIRSSEVDVGNCEADALSLDQLGQSRYLIQTEMADYNGNIYKRKRKIHRKYAH